MKKEMTKECRNCFHCCTEDGRMKCGISGLPVKVWQPGCLKWLDRVGEARRLLAEIEKNKKVQTQEDIKHMDGYLTMTFNAVQAAILFLEKVETKMIEMGKDQNWARERKKALRQIRDHVEIIWKLYNVFFQSELDNAMSRNRTRAEQDQLFNDNAEDVNEFCRIMMYYMDTCFQDYENLEKMFNLFKSLKGRGLYTEEDYKKFYVKYKGRNE